LGDSEVAELAATEDLLLSFPSSAIKEIGQLVVFSNE